jgi:2-haloacid dehalogenase
VLDTVIFDIGGVVLDWVPERAFETVMPAADVPAFMARIGFAEWNQANDARASLAAAEDDLVRRFPADEAGIRAYRRQFVHTITGEVPGTSAVIDDLAARSTVLGALTNWAGETFAVTRPRFQVFDRFRDIVVSGQEGLAKPDPRIFQLACDRLGVRPSQVAYVDDAAANVAAASELGMTGLRFRDAAQLRRELVGLGLL